MWTFVFGDGGCLRQKDYAEGKKSQHCRGPGKARATHTMAGEAQFDKSSEMGSWSDLGSMLEERVA